MILANVGTTFFEEYANIILQGVVTLQGLVG
nr:MAG TPA_asm: hypothetical protein [Caudoviricetes sp.]